MRRWDPGTYSQGDKGPIMPLILLDTKAPMFEVEVIDRSIRMRLVDGKEVLFSADLTPKAAIALSSKLSAAVTRIEK